MLKNNNPLGLDHIFLQIKNLFFVEKFFFIPEKIHEKAYFMFYFSH